MATGKWSAESKAKAVQRRELKLQRATYFMQQENRTKLENLESWFYFAEQVSRSQPFHWYKEIRLFITDHHTAMEHIIKLHEKLKGEENGK